MRPALAVLLLSLSLAFAGGFAVDVTGNSLHGRVGSILDDQLSITVFDSTGRPVSGVPVDFVMSSSEGSIAAPFTGAAPIILEGDTVSGAIDGLRLTTGAEGIAAISLKLGDETGNNTVEAVVYLPDGSEYSADYSALAIDLKEIIFQVIGGLAIFLLGMRMMSDSLQRVAGDRMRTILKRMTDNRILGLMAGALVTAVIQSSSATSVIAVSFVNSGLMVLRQAVGVIIGANIGTTITGQLIAFKVMAYSFPMIAIGFTLLAFSKNRRTQFWGRALVGLGLIFLGMTLMKDVLTPLKSSQAVHDFFMNFSSNPLLAILAGTLLTAIIQSSSATVGLTMTLAGAGLISLQGAVYLVLGDNIGTTITAQLSAIGGSRAARQTAMAHTMFNVFGAIYMGLLIANPNGFVMRFFQSTSSEPLRQVANAHSLFNIFNAIIFIPLVPMLARVCRLIIPDRKREGINEEVILQLDDHLLNTPALAMDNLERELVKMAAYASDTVSLATKCFISGSSRPETVMAMEDRVDYMQRDLTIYASKLFQGDLDTELSLKLPVIIHSINDIERVSDHAVNMVQARDMIKGDIAGRSGFLPEAAVEASVLVHGMFEEVVNALATHDREASRSALAYEERLNSLEDRAKRLYAESLNRRDGLGDMTDLVLLDFINYCERIGDHLTNVAQSLLGGGFWHGTDDIN